MTLQQKSTASPFDIVRALEQGAASLRRREWRQAHDLFQRLVSTDGAPPAAWEGLGHPHILPKRFSGLTVERGGFGASTIIRFRMRVAGRTQTFRAAITEPDPGRVLVETNLEGKLAVTTFTVTPADAGRTSDVSIATDLPVRTGILGIVERFVTTTMLQPLYEEELRRLNAFLF